MTADPGARGWLVCRVGSFEMSLDWNVEPGQTLVLFGPSGSGKTTALRAMAGLLRPAAGRMEVHGQTVYDNSARIWVPAHRRRVGYLTQQYHLFPHLNLARNIAYGITSGSRELARERLEELLDAFQLRGLERRRPWELSGGQQQRAALARAIAAEPRLLLLDEPFSALDAGLRRALRQELRATLERSPIPVVLVTHDREEALSMGDDVQVLSGGRCIARGSPVEVLGQPGQATVARLVGVENLFSMTVESRHPRDGTMRLCGVGENSNFTLEAPLDGGSPACGGEDRVTVGIRASDIILSRQELTGSSARNRFPGTVTRVEPRPPGYTVELDCGVPLRCQVTGASLEEMGIRPGQRLWAVFKASSCFLVREANSVREESSALPLESGSGKRQGTRGRKQQPEEG